MSEEMANDLRILNGTIDASAMERARRCYELKELERLGLSPDLEQRDMILAHLALVLKENKSADLVPEADEGCLFLRHFCDSLQPLLLFGFKKRAHILDIGAGGGFPSIPIRIFRPDLSFVLVEPNRKKAMFLKAVVDGLGLKNMEVHTGKPETVTAGKKADYVISRSAGTLQKFAQIAKPMLAKDGHMYTYKTKQFAAELEMMTSNKAKEGVRISEIAQYDLGNVTQGLSLVSMVFL